VALTNPAAVRGGQEMRVKVDGEPATTRVLTTYDGFSSRQDTYAYSIEDVAEGTACVRITRLGLWMVRVEHQIAEAKPTRYVACAVHVFEVRE
jgi:uncharacterized GH25 family protein